MTAKLADLKLTQAEALEAYKAEVIGEYQKGEKERTDKAVADALAAERSKKPSAATRAELKEIVPQGLAGREDLIGKLQDDNATCADAQKAVVAKLLDENKALAGKVEDQQKKIAGLGKNGTGVPALSLVPGADEPAGGGEFEALVQQIKTSEKLTKNKAILSAIDRNPKAHQEWVSRGAPEIKVA
jgi:hypothetical protein